MAYNAVERKAQLQTELEKLTQEYNTRAEAAKQEQNELNQIYGAILVKTEIIKELSEHSDEDSDTTDTLIN